MDKAEVSRQLRALVEERLFGNSPWTSNDPAVNSAIRDKLCAWGLETVDPVSRNIHTTELGSELQVDLMTVFMGHHEPYEAPNYLRRSKLITPAEADELADLAPRSHSVRRYRWRNVSQTRIRSQSVIG